MEKVRSIGIVAAIFIIALFVFVKCERIDQGHVGIKAKLSGTDKGVQDVTEVSGWVFYNRFAYSVFEFPTFVQHKEYTGDMSFTINTKDGSEFHVSPILNYHVMDNKAVNIFKKYRRELAEIEDGFIKTAVYDAFRVSANTMSADSLIGNRELFEKRVKRILSEQIEVDGFKIDQLASNLVYPETFKKAIEAKNAAVQKALQIENEVKQTEAQAKITIVKNETDAKVQLINANAYSTALLINAKAEAEANRLKNQSLSSILVQWQLANKWNGVLPQYGTIPQLFKSVGN